MTTRTAETSPLIRARVAGFLYLIANIPAPFTLLYLPSRLIVQGDAATTASHIIAAESLFRLAIVGNLFNSIGNILLVLDSFEHLLADEANITLISDFLKGALHLKLMATSREPLHLQAEWVFEV